MFSQECMSETKFLIFKSSINGFYQYEVGMFENILVNEQQSKIRSLFIIWVTFL